ncbi:MAG: VTT domain-containing protein [Bacilli bacterium]|nr:VTT domain-containing protein [bacterium]MDY2697256.1 VTT domain-containing protein [Bacilli bacterium]
MDLINTIVEYSTEVISNGGILFGMLLIMIESFIPVLPLSVFIALNTHTFGLLPGIVMSWVSTCIGCYISYLIFYYVSNNIIYKYLSKKTRNKIDKAVDKFQNISLANLTVIITLPFTPAFLINILAGVSGMSKKKYIVAVVIGKIFMVSFWGYIGKSFVESMTDISAIIVMSIMIIIAYALSKLIGKNANIE